MHRLGEFRAGKPEGLEPVMWSKPDKQGELKKKGHVVHNWKNRWFILQGDKLYYFKNRTVRASSNYRFRLTAAMCPALTLPSARTLIRSTLFLCASRRCKC